MTVDTGSVTIIGLLIVFLWGIVFGAGFTLGAALMRKASG